MTRIHSPALAAVFLSALTITAWALWPASVPDPAPARTIPAEADQFPGIGPADCTPNSRTPARQEPSE